MKYIKYPIIFIWQIFLNLIIFRREHISPISRRFTFLLVTIVAALVAGYIYGSPAFTISSVGLTITIAIVVYYSFSLKIFLLTTILTCCFSMPGIYYMQTSSSAVRAELSMIDAYGYVVKGTFNTTTDLSDDTLHGIANLFGDGTIRDFFIDTDNDIKSIKTDVHRSDFYNSSDILKKNLTLVLIIFSVLLSALTSYICVIFSHFEYVRTHKHIEEVRKG